MQRMHRAGALNLARQLRETTVEGPSPWEPILWWAIRIMIVTCHGFAAYWVVDALLQSPPEWGLVANILLLLAAAWMVTILLWLGGDL